MLSSRRPSGSRSAGEVLRSPSNSAAAADGNRYIISVGATLPRAVAAAERQNVRPTETHVLPAASVCYAFPVQDWITTFSSLGAFITAIAALWTIREMRQQRTSMYLPDVVASRADFYIYTDPSFPFGLPFALVSEQLRPDAPDVSPLTVSIHCYNIGLGAAKQLRARWSFDVQEFVFRISEADPDGTFQIWNDERELSLPFNERARLNLFKHQVDREEPYLLPAAAAGGPFRIVLPFTYVHLYTVSLLLSLKRLQDQPKGTWVAPPALNLELSYADVGGNRHVRRFEVRPDPIYAIEMPDATQITQCGLGEFVVKPSAA
jgi:hypothetical protein